MVYIYFVHEKIYYICGNHLIAETNLFNLVMFPTMKVAELTITLFQFILISRIQLLHNIKKNLQAVDLAYSNHGICCDSEALTSTVLLEKSGTS